MYMYKIPSKKCKYRVVVHKIYLVYIGTYSTYTYIIVTFYNINLVLVVAHFNARYLELNIVILF